MGWESGQQCPRLAGWSAAMPKQAGSLQVAAGPPVLARVPSPLTTVLGSMGKCLPAPKLSSSLGQINVQPGHSYRGIRHALGAKVCLPISIKNWLASCLPVCRLAKGGKLQASLVGNGVVGKECKCRQGEMGIRQQGVRCLQVAG